MPDTEYVEPLTGEELVVDLCSQIAETLRRDCNLRETDSYSGGYSAKVTVHLEAYGMDTATVDSQVTAGQAKNLPDPETDRVFDTSVEVPVETALDQVRERSDQPVPSLAVEDGAPVVRPRRYVRRERMVGAATGENL